MNHHSESTFAKNMKQESGFTLLELLISVVLFIIVTGAIYGLLEVARSDRLTTNQRVDAMQSLRVAMNAIGRDALNSGFGFPNTGATIPYHNLTGSPMWMETAVAPSGAPTVNILTAVMGSDRVNAAPAPTPPPVPTPAPTPSPCVRAATNPNDPRLSCTDQVSFIFKDQVFASRVAHLEAPKKIRPLYPVFAAIDPVSRLAASYKTASSEPMFIKASAPQQSTTYYLDGALRTTSIAPTGDRVNISLSGPDGIAGNADDLPNAGAIEPSGDLTGDLFVVVGGSQAAVGLATGFAADGILFDSEGMLGINTPGTTNPISQIPNGAVYKINWVAYRVIVDQMPNTNPQTGTLVRTVFGNNGAGNPQVVNAPIAYNIEDFQVQYVLNDGTAHDGTTGFDPWQVTQINITLTALSPVAERRSGAPIRVTLSSTFNTRNVSYDVR